MKTTRLFTGLIAILLTLNLSAQVKFGAKAGLNFTDVNADLYIDAVNDAPEMNTSFVLGIHSEIPINATLSFQPELQYARRGFGINQGTSFDVFGLEVPVGANARTVLNYVEMPLLMKAKVGNEKIKAYGLIGPSLGRATSAKIESSVTFLIDWNLPDVNIDLDDNMYNRNDISAVIGAGAEVSTETGSLFADVRYQRGFNSVLDVGITDLNIKHTSVQFAVGYAHSF